MRRRGAAKLAGALLALAMAASACGGAGSGGSGIFRLGITEPDSIDPYNIHESEGGLIAKQLFEGVATVVDGKVVANGSGKWETDSKCETWTITIPDSNFSNGEKVKAEDYIRGFNRVVQPEAASNVAAFLEDIDGYNEVKTTKKLSGATVKDEKTFEVKLAAGKSDCEFYKRLVHPAFVPVPSVAGEWNNKTFNDMPVGNGPFKMKEAWQHDKSITLVPNDKYVGKTKPAITEVQFTIENIENEYKGYQAGQRDWSRIPPSLIPQAEAKYKGKILKEVTAGVNYITVSTDQAPLNNKDVRKAISYAINREEINKGVFKGTQVPSDSYIPPIITDYYQKGVCEACTYDEAKAQELAKKGGLTPGTEIEFLFNDDGGHKGWVEAAAQQVSKTLGIKVVAVPKPKFKDQLADMKKPGWKGLGRTAWSFDFPTPLNLLEPTTRTNAGSNFSKWSNPEYDKLLDQAKSAADDAKRKEIVNKAEKLLMDEMPIIPFTTRTQFRAYSDKWTNVKLDYFENPNLAEIKPKG